MPNPRKEILKKKHPKQLVPPKKQLNPEKEILKKIISKKKSINQYCEIINTEDFISDNESPLTAAKRSKER